MLHAACVTSMSSITHRVAAVHWGQLGTAPHAARFLNGAVAVRGPWDSPTSACLARQAGTAYTPRAHLMPRASIWTLQELGMILVAELISRSFSWRKRQGYPMWSFGLWGWGTWRSCAGATMPPDPVVTLTRCATNY
jgi:hypothetical protein